MISTATAAVNEAVTSSVASSWATSVPRAISSTTGTKTAEIRSARRWAAALPLCASSTSLAIRASRVSEPTLVASTTSSAGDVQGGAGDGVARSGVHG